MFTFRIHFYPHLPEHNVVLTSNVAIYQQFYNNVRSVTKLKLKDW
jgi:hypothetical protein